MKKFWRGLQQKVKDVPYPAALSGQYLSGLQTSLVIFCTLEPFASRSVPPPPSLLFPPPFIYTTEFFWLGKIQLSSAHSLFRGRSSLLTGSIKPSLSLPLGCSWSEELKKKMRAKGNKRKTETKRQKKSQKKKKYLYVSPPPCLSRRGRWCSARMLPLPRKPTPILPSNLSASKKKEKDNKSGTGKLPERCNQQEHLMSKLVNQKKKRLTLFETPSIVSILSFVLKLLSQDRDSTPFYFY